VPIADVPRGIARAPQHRGMRNVALRGNGSFKFQVTSFK
jgi:hypothetical protein